MMQSCRVLALQRKVLVFSRNVTTSQLRFRSFSDLKFQNFNQINSSVPKHIRSFSTEQDDATTKDAEFTDKSKVEPPRVTERIVGTSKKHEFQSETKKILDIVVRSLYTEKEVFIRELISNASDALEKVRHAISSGQQVENPELPLEVNIFTNAKEKQLIIQDNGIGMTEEELITNLGRIGHSGSSEFMKKLASKDSSIIGQFGVGFYSVLMVAKKVTVFSKGSEIGSKGYCWVSDGSGSYDIFEAEGVHRGSKIVIDLNNESEQYSDETAVNGIIKKYSNFVGFDIKLNENKVNTIKALWSLSKDQVSEKDHSEFFKFIAHSYTDPLFHLHYSTDSPINIRALFYVGQQNQEKFGLGVQEPGISLFCRKVMIQSKTKGLLPDWLRFVKGVVDSEDIPLNISREFLQDSALIQRIKMVLTKRILKWFDEESKKDAEKYAQFFSEFANFFKEGITTDGALKDDLAKLLRYESSAKDAGKLTSFEEYISRMKPDQKEIYYLIASSREYAESSPYYEGFKAAGYEVLFLYSPLDDFVMTNNLKEYKKYKIVSAESSSVPLTTQSETEELSKQEAEELCKWIRDSLQDKLSDVKPSSRLVESPAIIVGNEANAYRRMMKYVDPQRAPAASRHQLEINTKHPVVKKLHSGISSKPKLSKAIAEQLLDNAMISAGLMDDARPMLSRVNILLGSALNSETDLEDSENVTKSQSAPKSENVSNSKNVEKEIFNSEPKN